MATLGLLTAEGRAKSIEASGNVGWKIKPIRFEIADTAGVFNDARVGARTWGSGTSYASGDEVVPAILNGFYYRCTTPGVSGGGAPAFPTTIGNTVVDGGAVWTCAGITSGGIRPVWFSALISSRVQSPPNTVDFIMTIPPGADPGDRNINEIYVFAEDQNGNPFLLIVAQPDTTVIYRNDRKTTFRVALTLTNANVGNLFVFQYTQATEIAEHTVDPNAHPDIRDTAKFQFNLAENGDMTLDWNPAGFNLALGTFGYGPAKWAGQLVATSKSGTLLRREDSSLRGSRSLKFQNIALSGGARELHVRYRLRAATARHLTNRPWQASTDYTVGDVVRPSSGNPNLLFQAIASGVSDSTTEPVWPPLQGDQIIDGGVTWEAILGRFSIGFDALHDTGSTQFAVIKLKTPVSGEDNFDGVLDTFYTTGPTDHPILTGVINPVKLAAVAIPDVDSGLEVEVVIDVGTITGKNFEFGNFKIEAGSVATPFAPLTAELETLQSSAHLMDYLLDYQLVVGTQAQVSSGAAMLRIDELSDAAVAAGDRILVLPGTHSLTGAINLSRNNLTIQAADWGDAVIDQAGTRSFTLSGQNCRIDVRFAGTFAGGIVLSGAGSHLFGMNVPLANVAVSNGAMAETSGSAGGIKRSASAAPGHDRELIDRAYALHDSPLGWDMIVGTAAQVTAGRANATIDDLDNSNVSNGFRILLLDETPVLNGNVSVSRTDLFIRHESPAGTLDFGAFTVAFSGARLDAVLRPINAEAGNLTINGAGSKAVLIGADLSIVSIGSTAVIVATGTNGGMYLGSGIALPYASAGSMAQLLDLLGGTDITGPMLEGITILTGNGAAYTVLGTDILIINRRSVDVTIALPSVSSSLRRKLVFINDVAHNLILDGHAAELVEGAVTYTLSAQYDTVEIRTEGTKWYVLYAVGAATFSSLTVNGLTVLNGALHEVSVALTGNGASYTVLGTDLVVINRRSVDVTIALPSVSSSLDRRIKFINDVAHGMILDANASETIDGALTLKVPHRYGAIDLYCDGTAWFSDPSNPEWALLTAGPAYGTPRLNSGLTALEVPALFIAETDASVAMTADTPKRVLATPPGITVYDAVSFSVNAQETTPRSVFFKSDGSKMYVAGATGIVYQYSLPTPWVLTGATYDGVSFSVAGQDTVLRSVFFKSDGSKMYVLGSTNKTVYQYSLPTPWVLTGATYDSVSFSVAGQDGSPHFVFFKSDGSKMYMIGAAGIVYQYSLPTPWVLTGATYDSVSFSVAGQVGATDIFSSIFFKSDGSKMYAMGNGAGIVYQYSLPTPWVLTGATYDGVSFSVAGQDTVPRSVFFKSDGSKMYVLGSTNKTVYQYSLPSVWLLNGSYTRTLPTTGVMKGQSWAWDNLQSVAGCNIVIKSSGGSFVWLVCPGNECELVALQDTPTTAAHWKVSKRGWPIYARVHKSANQTTVPEGVDTKITFNTVDSDPAGMFNDANDRFILPLPGRWELKGAVQWLLNASAAQVTLAGFKFNGAALVSGDGMRLDTPGTAAGRVPMRVMGEALVTVPGTDYVELFESYNDAGAVDSGIIQAFAEGFVTQAATWMSAKYLGPL